MNHAGAKSPEAFRLRYGGSFAVARCLLLLFTHISGVRSRCWERSALLGMEVPTCFPTDAAIVRVP